MTSVSEKTGLPADAVFLTELKALIRELAPPDLDSEEPVLRLREGAGGLCLEVKDIDWERGPHCPVVTWKERICWGALPSIAQLRDAIHETYQSSQCFAVCRFCAREGRKARVVVGHSFNGTTCDGCASTYIGVVY